MIYDGEYYESEGQKPDLGNWRAEQGDKPATLRSYYGFSNEVSKLPKYDSLKTGSTAYCLDNGDTYIYSDATKQWYKS